MRAPLLLEPIDEQIETLQACETEGAIDDLLLRSWPKEVSLSDESPHREVLENYERFRGWAADRGVSVRPPFRERETTSQVTGETRERLVTPLLCLEVYEGDDLIGVFPHTDERTEETYTTDEAIATLRTGAVPTPLEPVDDESAPDTDGGPDAPISDPCPDCGGELIDGQGLFACGDCGWVGRMTDSGRYVAEAAASEATAERQPSPQSR
ncbi:hypothetical protein A6E15_08745 [Natrinema saccharevitans]|uniref:Uncharacterized protein n=1 Tax=Natrinema saccharevitans TaxID=301967 RepID=A0A1S8B236_9EURY|nr:hypothetical protein A6E15_08745 [Natrinema saccharevitans]